MVTPSRPYYAAPAHFSCTLTWYRLHRSSLRRLYFSRAMVPRNPGSTTSDSGQQYPSDGSSSSQHQFDWLNWFYWSIWWQQYSYWTWSQSLSLNHPQPNNTNNTTSPSIQSPPNNPYYQYNPYYIPTNVPPSWAANYQGHPSAPNSGGVAQPQANRNFLTLQIRIRNGFETIIAAPWKRFIAEVIDTILFAFLLKAYLPQADLRIPEILLEGSDVWDLIEVEEDVEEIKTVLQTFIFSVLMQKLHHAILAAVWIAVFSCTPGKWLMGLRVIGCSSIHLTRTRPGHTIRVVPGGRITLWRALSRSIFKAGFSLFIPLLVFFFSLHRGQTKYDQVLHCTVVDARTLYRPVHSSRNTAGAQGAAQPQVIRIG